MAVITNATFKTQRVESTQTTGVAPLVVASTTAVTNLNADQLDGQTGSYYLDAANLTGTVASARIAGSYTGITGVGTLAAGTWNATAIGATYGGTAQTTWTLGDLLYSSAADTLAKLAGNTATAKQFLSQTGTGTVSAAPAWASLAAGDILSGTFADARISETSVTQHEAALSIATSQITGTLGPTFGGTGVATYATGDILYASASNTLAKLAAGTNTHVLTLAGGVPTWAAPTGGLSNAFTAIDNSAGTEQFAASGSDAIQFAAGADLSVAFDNVNKRVTFAFTGGVTGITRGYADITGDTGTSAASGADAITITGSGGISTTAADGTPDTLTITLGNHSAALLTSGTVATARLGTGTADATTFLRGDQTWAAAGVDESAAYSWTGAHDWSQAATFGSYVQGTTTNGYLDLRGDSGASNVWRLNDAGHLGFGTDIEAWSGYRAIEWSRSAIMGGGDIEIFCNAYYDGSYKYKATNPAASIGITTGLLLFKVAASGTANTAVSFTTRLEMNTTGIGFFGATPVAKPTGVAVTASGIHAALVSLGLIAA